MNDEQLIWEAYKNVLKENDNMETEDPILVKNNLENTILKLEDYLKDKNVLDSDVSDVMSSFGKTEYVRELEDFLYTVNPEFNSDLLYQISTDEWVNYTVKPDHQLFGTLKDLTEKVKRLGVLAFTDDQITTSREERESMEDEAARERQYRSDVLG